MSKRISRSTALELIQASKGKFFSATFVKKDNSIRVLNGKLNSVSKLGYVKMDVIEKGKKGIKSANLQTMRELCIGGETCVIR